MDNVFVLLGDEIVEGTVVRTDYPEGYVVLVDGQIIYPVPKKLVYRTLEDAEESVDLLAQALVALCNTEVKFPLCREVILKWLTNDEHSIYAWNFGRLYKAYTCSDMDNGPCSENYYNMRPPNSNAPQRGQCGPVGSVDSCADTTCIDPVNIPLSNHYHVVMPFNGNSNIHIDQRGQCGPSGPDDSSFARLGINLDHFIRDECPVFTLPSAQQLRDRIREDEEGKNCLEPDVLSATWRYTEIISPKLPRPRFLVGELVWWEATPDDMIESVITCIDSDLAGMVTIKYMEEDMLVPEHSLYAREG